MLWIQAICLLAGSKSIMVLLRLASAASVRYGCWLAYMLHLVAVASNGRYETQGRQYRGFSY